MKIVKFACIFVAFFVGINNLHANWNPRDLPFEKKEVFEVLDNPNLTDLEEKIFEYVKNSWCSKEKAKLLIELVILTRPKICVEIGPFMGASTLPMVAGLQYLGRGNAFIIDAWSNEEAIKGLPSEDPNTVWWGSLDMQAIKNHFLYMVNYWSLNLFCQILHMNSEQAIAYIPPINFLHLDGNFSESGALLDSELYLPKVVPGGYVLLSNALMMVGGKPTKMKALWPIFDQCDIVCELEGGNTLLFRKKIKVKG